MTTTTTNKVFDYRTLRLLIGLIAFSLPLVVELLATATIPSISASYYTEARDAFVGMLFIVGAFLWAYNGHTDWQGRWSKVAAVAESVSRSSQPPVTCVARISSRIVAYLVRHQ